MIKCSLCGKTIPQDEQARNQEILSILGVEKSAQDPLSLLYLNLLHAFQSRICDTCGAWICSPCVRELLKNKDSSMLRHEKCGGLFRQPK